MEKIPLREYRCKCGKLLFKGLLFLGVVEIKCKRCGALVMAEDIRPGSFALVESNADLLITIVSGHPRKVLGYTNSDLIGKRLDTFFPFLNDAASKQSEHRHGNGRAYTIHNTSQLLKDGGSAPLTTYVMPKREKDSFGGYRIFNWLAGSPER